MVIMSLFPGDPMTFSYCVTNASLTQRLLAMLQNRLGENLVCTTVIFFNDFWILRIVLRPGTSNVAYNDCRAILQEHGIPYVPNPLIQCVFLDMDQGETLFNVMNRYRVVILFHGVPQPEEISAFQQDFIAGLGYCPPSLV